MDIFQQMELYKKDFTPREQRIYEIFTSEPDVVAQNSTVAIAARYGLAQSAISRFCQKIGFGSFSDFRMALAVSLSAHSFASTPEKEDHDVVDYMCDLMRATQKALPELLLRALSLRITKADRIYVTGTAHSSLPARLLAEQLIQFSRPAYFIEPGYEVESLHIINSGDVVFLFSAHNPTHKDFLKMAADISPARRPYTILITQSPNHPLNRLVNETVCLPTWRSLHYPLALDISYSSNVFCHLLTAELLKVLGDGEKTGGIRTVPFAGEEFKGTIPSARQEPDTQV